ncbi:MAG: energy transducer TonB [Candidatus Acidiferrum sp.]
MIWHLTLLFILSLSPSGSARPQDSGKSSQPAGQKAPLSKIKRIRIGGNVAKSMLKHKIQPQYPMEARDQRIQGTVRLHIVLSTAGKVQQLEVLSGDPILAKAAATAVRKWEHRPFLLNGRSRPRGSATTSGSSSSRPASSCSC